MSFKPLKVSVTVLPSLKKIIKFTYHFFYLSMFKEKNLYKRFKTVYIGEYVEFIGLYKSIGLNLKKNN